MATIIGTAGNDSLLGTIGDDVIVTGGGNDAVDGSAGDDIVRLTGTVPDGNQMNYIIDGGTGHDTLDLTQWAGGPLIDYDVGGFLGFSAWSADGTHQNWVGYMRNFEEVWLGPNVQSFSAYQESSDPPGSIPGWTIIGSDGADNITDSRGFDHISSGAGDDLVITMGGSDQVSLGDGNDLFTVEGITGYPDQVTIDGGAGTDTLQANYFQHVLHYAFDLAAGTGQVGATSFTLSNMENVQIEAQGTGVAAEAGRTISLAGDDHDNSLTATGDAASLLLGRGGDDSLLGYELQGALTAYGGSGNDTIYGGNGADWLNGGGHYAGDTVPADSADDGADYIDGKDGNDHIFGNSQVSVQGAADGADRLFGGNGSDYVNGNAGNDTISGGAGSDRLYGGADNDNITGDAGNDHINGNKGDDFLYGGDGNDELLGGQGNDYLNGGAGFDTLTGNAGNDTFYIGESAHFTTAGPDAGRTDIITDFQDGQDKIALYSSAPTLFHPGAAADFAGAVALANTALATADDSGVAAVQIGSDTYLFFDNFAHAPASAVLLLNVSASAITTADFAY